MRQPAHRLVTVVSAISLSFSTALDAQSRADFLKACADQRKEETQAADAEKRKQQTDAVAQYQVGMRNCGIDRGCKAEVTRQYRAEITRIANEYTLKVAEIRKHEIDCTTNGGQGPNSDPGIPSPTTGMYELSAELNTIRSNPLDNLLGAADQFFKGLLDWGVGTLTFLAQPRGSFTEFGEPMKQVIDYLVHHKPGSFADQYEKARKGVETFAENPARTLGRELPNLVPMPSAKAAEQANSAAAAGRRLTQLNAEAKRFTPLANQLTTPRPVPRRPAVAVEPPPLAGPERGPVVPPAGSPYRGPPPEFGNTPLQPRSGIPTTCFENQCWQNARAVDRYWRDGVWREPSTRGYPLAEELRDLPAPGAVIMRDLRQDHGGAGALDPLHGSIGQQAHAHGVPVASSKSRIEEVMREKGPGAQGYAFVRWEQTVGNEVIGGGHVVNVRSLENNVVEFFDRATQHVAGLRGTVEPAVWQHAKEVFFFLSREGPH